MALLAPSGIMNRRGFRSVQIAESSIPQSGLALWLKADVGVSKFSYNYISQIVISGTSNPSFAGTYIADGVPSYDYDEGQINNYTLTGSTGKSISWDSNNQSYLLSSNSEGGSFSSGDGETWTPNIFVSQIVITGFTGIYSGANGTYNGDGNYYTKVGGGFIISSGELSDTASEQVIATAPANYSGSWTPATFISGVTLHDAGTSDVNGTYTRSDTLDFRDTFYASDGRTISYLDNYYETTNDEYRCTNGFLEDWVVELGDSPEPSGIIIQTARTIGSATSTTTTRPTGSVSGVVTTSTADNVISWEDQSGNGNNASVEFQGEQPTFASSFLNGKPAIKFNGQGQVLQVSSSASLDFTAETSCFIVVKYDGDGGNNDVIYIKNADDGSPAYPAMYGMVGVDADNGNVSFSLNAGGWSDRDSDVSISDGIPRLFSMIFNTNVDQSIYCNGILTSQQVLGDNISTSSGTLQIGGYNKSFDSQDFFNGKIAEIIMYNRAVTNTERQQVEAYLNTKYAIY